MHAHGYLLYLPPTALKAKFVMIEESSKILFDVNLAIAELGNPTTWVSQGITPSNTGNKLAIVMPVSLDAFSRDTLQAQGFNPNFEVGELVSITRQEPEAVYGTVIGKANVCPYDETAMNWEKIREYKKDVMHDELRNGLLAKVYGGVRTDQNFVHPDVLANMPRPWHRDAATLNDELDGMFASADAAELRWELSRG